MGGTSSTRRVTFEADENENITVVKGIRLSENVIDRMKETSPSGSKSQRYSGAYGASVSDEELKRRVAEELALEQAKKESENQKRLKQSKELDRERAFANEQLTRAILRERISSEEERAKAKHLDIEDKAKQLEEKDRVIKKQDAFYKEQLARLEERSSEFYKVTTEQYQKAAEEVEAKFNSYAAVHHRRSFCMLPDKIYMMLSKKGGMSFILCVLICKPKFFSVTARTPSRPSAALIWPTSICAVSIRPNRACLRREDKLNF
ncbi:MICOS complex subunit MIC19 isoform X1 [Prionailurus bengalensis]|uniref:MICOS complex subunit MIC19 isoform X1 n=1 Tax=Prionailurus bengalensis TaxID=37029 RepID=UPI001CA8FE23|nr:MICOS complex subunit MIC19 isoform X1 [Prionailurus bengalensis]